MVVTDPRAIPAGAPHPAGPDEPGSGRHRVLTQAALLFLRHGYRETTLRDIAAAAGMKAASIYYHFDSKEQLLAAVLDTGIERITAGFVETARAMPIGIDPQERLRRHVLAHLAALFEHGPFTTCHVTVFPSAPGPVKALGVPSRNAYEQLWAALLGELAGEGHLRPGVDLGLHRILLLSAANSTLGWFDPSGPRTVDELATALTEQFWTGVALPRPATRRPARRPSPQSLPVPASKPSGATP